VTEILLCNQMLKAPQLYQQCGISLDQLYCGAKVNALTPYRPYLTGPRRSSVDNGIVNTLNVSKKPRNLFDLSNAFGSDDTVAIAEVMTKLKESQMAVAGATASVYSACMGEFGSAVQRYQDTLTDYRNTLNSSDASVSPGLQRSKLRTKWWRLGAGHVY